MKYRRKRIGRGRSNNGYKKQKARARNLLAYGTSRGGIRL